MMKLILILLLSLIFPTLGFATEKYIVEKPDGSVAVIHYLDGSKDSIEDVIRDNGFDLFPVIRVEDKDIPSSRVDRKYWKVSGGKIVIDAVKKQADLDAEAQKQIEREAVKEKLKVNDQELRVLKEALQKV